MHTTQKTLFGLTLILAPVIISATNAQTWSRAYREPTQTTDPQAVTSIPGGGLAIAQNLDGRLPAILRLDAGGNPLWHNAYGDPQASSGSVFGVRVDALRRLIAIGQNNTNPWFGVINADTGQPIHAAVTDIENGAILDALPLADGGFVATGWIARPGGDADVMVVSVDRFGDKRWQKRIDFAGNFDDFGDAIVEISGTFLIIGRTNSVGRG